MKSPFPGMDPHDDINYRAEPDLPLDPDDAAWAHAMLTSQGLRT